MSFKLRFALQLASVVAIILLICFLSIYFLYADYRKEDFYNRMRSEGLQVHNLISKLALQDQGQLLEIVREVRSSIITDEEISFVDSNSQLLFSIPQTPDTTGFQTLFNKIAKGEFTETRGNRQFVGIYLAKKIYG